MTYKQEDMPLEIIKDLITDCSSFDLLKMKEEYLKSKKKERIINN